ncbi:hypothetical protein [Actinoplanes sp. NPDC049316]|uniref:hypothetical protein n=1 Tax=Actinoplanes sp. NPDC049316 TaxID=3154727 RepID=UPI003427C831
MNSEYRSETGPDPIVSDRITPPTADGRPGPITAVPPSRPRWSTLWVLVLVGLPASGVGAFASHLYDLAQSTSISRTVIVPPAQAFTGGTMNVATVEPATVMVEAPTRRANSPSPEPAPAPRLTVT